MAKATQVIDGAECSVETGYGRVVKIEHEEGKRNAHVTIDAEHLRQPVKAWADMEGDHQLVGRLLHCRDAGSRMAYRIVVKRKASIDTGLPFDKVPVFDRVRDLTEVDPDLASAAGSNGAASAPQPPASAPSSPAAADTAPPPPSAPEPAEGLTCPICTFPMRAGSIAKMADGLTFAHSACLERATTETSNGSRRILEGKPWEAVNPDGSANLGSYAAQAAVGMVGMAHKLLVDHRVRSGESGPPTAGQVRGLAHILLGAADVAQAAVRSDRQVDRMAQSHARARGLVHTALEAFPVPWGADDAARSVWAGQLGTYTAELLKVAGSLS